MNMDDKQVAATGWQYPRKRASTMYQVNKMLKKRTDAHSAAHQHLADDDEVAADDLQHTTIKLCHVLNSYTHRRYNRGEIDPPNKHLYSLGVLPLPHLRC